MDVIFEYRRQRFIWDAAKAQANLKKHGVAFETAVEVLDDPFAVLDEAGRHEEWRYAVIGRTEAEAVLYVVAVDVERSLELVRLISARPATAGERKRYEESYF